MVESRPEVARNLFAPIAADYERWARILSMGQDARWRRTMIAGLEATPRSMVLDLAAGTGQMSRSLASRGHAVVACDQSPEMLAWGAFPGPAVQATAERLPFADDAFDAVTFGYLLRYVDDVYGCMAEVARVVRRGGRVGVVDFGRPSGTPGLMWRVYTRLLLPGAGRLIGHGWHRVGRFLGPSIDDFSRRFPPDELAEVWTSVGIGNVRHRRMSLGGGLVMWGTRT